MNESVAFHMVTELLYNIIRYIDLDTGHNI